MSYCTYIESIVSDEKKALHQHYHDKLYGFPIHDDNELFGRLILEINQAGLSWETILKKEPAFRLAYDNFNLWKIANYSETDKERLLNDAGIIRNRLKINAAIENAKTILLLQKEFGSFEKWLEKQGLFTKEEWVKLFRKTFKFTGGEIVGEFLMSIGYLEGAHDKDCPIWEKIKKERPMWMRTYSGRK